MFVRLEVMPSLYDDISTISSNVNVLFLSGFSRYSCFWNISHLQIASLLKHSGISLSDFRNLSHDDLGEEAAEDEMDFTDFEMDDSFVLEYDLSKNEAAIICYVAGYIGTKMKKHVKCSFCEEMFLTDMHLADP